jgi:tetratricopeptide (TPR) repeat protein
MKYARWSILVFCLIVIGSFRAYSQEPASGNAPEKAFYNMTKLAPAEYTKGNLDRAHAIAEDLLKESPNWQKNWNYGNAIQAANIVLGRVALRQGEIDDAKDYLLKAGHTPGSPQLNTFGPDMTLARDLLKLGEKDVVLEYFGLCEKFWKMDNGKLDQWGAEVKSGQTPEFGANLRYLGF